MICPELRRLSLATLVYGLMAQSIVRWRAVCAYGVMSENSSIDGATRPRGCISYIGGPCFPAEGVRESYLLAGVAAYQVQHDTHGPLGRCRGERISRSCVEP